MPEARTAVSGTFMTHRKMREDEYITLTSDTAEGFYSEKRSKFYAFARHAESEEEIKTLLQDYRKRFHDARHVCYAYVLGAERNDYRANDDGEPSSTAGKPILGQINKRGLTDTLVVVVRYYGGVNLGTGGLIVAYRSAAADALSNARTKVCVAEEKVAFRFPYTKMNAVMKVVKDMGANIVSQSYDKDLCELQMRIRKTEARQFRDKLEKSSH